MGKIRQEPRPGRSKMTVIIFQLDGEDSTVQEGIRTINHAVTSIVKPAAMPPKSVSPANVLTPGNGGDESGDDETAADEIQDESSELHDGGAVERDTPPRVRTFKTPEVVNVDLTAGPMGLKEFLSQKKVADNDNQRYLAIAFWFKEYRQIPEIHNGHIWTAYRHMKWNPQPDIAQPFRSMKKSGLFGKGSARGSYAINHVGEGRVNEMSSGVSA